jgi:CubicO group peptidase (beta-lactamase class C family)
MLSLLLLGVVASRTAAAQEPLSGHIDAFVRAELERQKVPGVGIGIAKNGKVLLFQAGSIGKQFTAMAVMLQVEAGKLALTDPLTKFFPGAPASWGGITLRHLLNHTSGPR